MAHRDGSFIRMGDFASGTVLRTSDTQKPTLIFNAIVSLDGSTADGNIISALTPAWREISRALLRDPAELLALSPRQWEELIAAWYDKAGFDEVVLTPRSADLGRDVIATKRGHFSVRIIDQVKAYRPGRLVTADDVRATLGVLTADQGATKAVITTTADFAPKVATDKLLRPFMPHRLQLVNGQELVTRLKDFADDSD